MSRFQQLSICHLLAKKLALTGIVLASMILLSGCTGDSLDGMTTNADGSTKLSAQDEELAKSMFGSVLPSFYTIELTWDPPTTKSSGSPLSTNEIKEYRIVYFQEGIGTKTSLSVDNATTRIGIPVGSKGTYHFEITTVDRENRESDPKLVTASL